MTLVKKIYLGVVLLFLLLLVIVLTKTKSVKATSSIDTTPPALNISPTLSINPSAPTLEPAPTLSVTLTCDDSATGNSGCSSITYDVHSYKNPDYVSNEYTNSPWPISGAVNNTNTASFTITEVSSYPYVKINASATDGASNTTTASYYFIFGHAITGIVYYDSDHDGVSGTADSNYAGIFAITVTNSGGTPVYSCGPGGTACTNPYSAPDLPPDTYTVKIDLTGQTNPSYVVNFPCAVDTLTQTCTPSTSITIPNSLNSYSQDFYVTQLYSISGIVFNDIDKNAQLNIPPDTSYKLGATISVPTVPVGAKSISSATSSTTDGSYTFGDLISGTYTIQIAVPSGYTKTYPLPGTDYYTANVGDGAPACSLTPDSPDPTYASPKECSALGSLSGVDFGISDSIVWQQCVGADCSLPGGDTVPPGALTTCGAGSYAIGTNTVSTDPGVYFGQAPSGTISDKNWIANPYNFSPVTPRTIRTSYGYITTTLTQAGITTNNKSLIDLSGTDPATNQPYCGSGGVNNCTLETNSLPNGAYIANPTQHYSGDTSNSTANDFVLNTYTFPYALNKDNNYVILVNGNLYINGKILVPNGSTATFYVSGNIVVDQNVGESTPTVCTLSTKSGVNSTGCDIEGFYSADNKFTIQGKNACTSGPDYQLNIDGAVVVNAADTSGGPTTIDNQRDLCAGDQTCPTYTITERPDMILNAPRLIEHPNYIWQEVAPLVTPGQ